MQELRQVLAGESGDVRWTVSAGPDPAGGLYTFVSRTRGHADATSGMGGPTLYPGQLINTWIGRADGTPPFVLVRAAPEVERVTVVLASGDRRELALSSVIDEFGLRFGAAPLPEEDPPERVEVSQPDDGPQSHGLRGWTLLGTLLGAQGFAERTAERAIHVPDRFAFFRRLGLVS